MRVLQVYKTCPAAPAGGVDVVLLTLIEQLQRQGHRAILLRTADGPSRTFTVERIAGVTTYTAALPMPPRRWTDLKGLLGFTLRFPTAVWALCRLVRSQGIDVAHLHTLQHYHLYFAICRALGLVRYVVTLHGSEVQAYPSRSTTTRYLWRIGLRGSSGVAAVSASLGRRARKTFPFLPDIRVILNGLDEKAYPASSRSDLETALGAPLPARYFVSIGSLREAKGHDLAIDGWRQVTARYPDTHLLIIGGGELHHEYARRIDALNLKHRVRLVGQCPRPLTLALVRSSLGLVMPSRREGLGIAILEAGIVGVPVICSDIEPFREIIRPEEEGLQFRAGDADELADAVLRLMGQPGLASGLARALSRRVREEFSANRMTADYLDLYRATLARAPRAR